MKIVYFFWILLVCTILPQKEYKIITDDNTQKPMVVGICKQEIFTDSSFSGWYNTEFENYEPKREILNKIIRDYDDISIKIVLGTWCSDSRREVPRFFRILKESGFPTDDVKLIFVDRTKNAFFIDIEDLEIKLVPTFIVYRDDQEIGRVIETPLLSLEEDLLNILNGRAED